MKVLNLYAGIGGNRKLWGDDLQVTAVENDPAIAAIYQENFPNDTVIVGDAHQYLLEHFTEYGEEDLIWSSPPCQSHSKARYLASSNGDYAPVYPDMKLYQEIIFLRHFCKSKWVVENVNPYYTPLIAPTAEISKNRLWANFRIEPLRQDSKKYHFNTVDELQAEKGFKLEGKKGIDKVKVLRNCVHPAIGLHVLRCAFKIRQEVLA